MEGITNPVSKCHHYQYKIEYWGNSTRRRCKFCNKPCQIISADDIEETEPEIELPEIEKGIPIEVTI